MNSVISRSFGKQMTKETQLRLYNITSKAVPKYGSENWPLKQKRRQRLEAAQTKFLRALLRLTQH
jgi:hypothetical protein